MTNEELYEYYGWKSAQKGFFTEWRNETASLMGADNTLNRWDAGQKAYKQLAGSND